MPIWERINQQQAAEGAAAKQAEADRIQVAQQRANEQRLRGQQLLSESGALQALEALRGGLEQDDRRNGLTVGGTYGLLPGVATLTVGVSDTHCKEIEVRVDDQRDEVVVMRAGTPRWQGERPEPVEQRISRAQWESDPSAIETAIAGAYLRPPKSVAISKQHVTTPTPPSPPERPRGRIARWWSPNSPEEIRRANAEASYEFHRRDER
jgi:hypothetical protein